VCRRHREGGHCGLVAKNGGQYQKAVRLRMRGKGGRAELVCTDAVLGRRGKKLRGGKAEESTSSEKGTERSSEPSGVSREKTIC